MFALIDFGHAMVAGAVTMGGSVTGVLVGVGQAVVVGRICTPMRASSSECSLYGIGDVHKGSCYECGVTVVDNVWLFAVQDDQSSGVESSSSSVTWPAPPLPSGYPWPAPPPMSVMPPMGVRPPMMFGPPPGAFPPGRLMPPPRIPLNAVHDGAGKESQEIGIDSVGMSDGSGDKSAEESLHPGADNMVDMAHMGNFPRPVGCGDWHMRGPPPFMHGPNMPRPDMMRGPRPLSLLGDGPGPRGFPGVPPAGFGIPQNFPSAEEGEGEEYGEEDGEYGEEEGEYDEEEEGNEEEWGEEEGDGEEEYNEECDEFPFDGNDDLFPVHLHH